MNNNKNLAAYPQTAFDKDGNLTTWEKEHTGLTKREYLATKAMQGICVNAGRNSHSFNKPDEIAKTAVSIADALLSVLGNEA